MYSKWLPVYHVLLIFSLLLWTILSSFLWKVLSSTWSPNDGTTCNLAADPFIYLADLIWPSDEKFIHLLLTPNLCSQLWPCWNLDCILAQWLSCHCRWIWCRVSSPDCLISLWSVLSLFLFISVERTLADISVDRSTTGRYLSRQI